MTQILSQLTMLLGQSRREVLSFLNSRYILGRIPSLHAILFIIEMVLTGWLVAKFNSSYAKKPILTTMVTNAILGAIADTVAQSITAYRSRSIQLPTSQSQGGIISDGIELDDVNEKPMQRAPEINRHVTAPQPFDFERMLRFMSYGFIMAPVQFKWYGMLNKTFPLTSKSGTVPALQRVAMDQLVFAPIGLGVFFSFMTIAEGNGKRMLVKKFEDLYIPTLKANYILWPAVQVINFRLMPLQFQIPFVSTIGIAWTAYLSLTNSSEEE